MIKKILKIKTFPYLPTLKLKNKSETGIFFSWPYQNDTQPRQTHHTSSPTLHRARIDLAPWTIGVLQDRLLESGYTGHSQEPE